VVTWRKPLILLVLAAIAAVAWWRLHPSETRRVRRQLDRLANCVSKSESEGATALALKMNALGGLFASEVEVNLTDFPGNGTYASSEIPSHVARFRPSCRSIALSFHDLRIEIGPPRQARAFFTARLLVTATNGETQSEMRTVQVLLQRDEDRTWRIARVEEPQVFQR
jgi:hypothetical protein